MIATQTAPIASQTVLADRFISTEVAGFTLLFPAVWVGEILRIDRSQILDLPFYDPLLVGVVHHSGEIIPLIAAARLLKVGQFATQDRSIVVRLDSTAGALANIGLIVDRAIGSINRQDLPPAIFSTSAPVNKMLLMQPDLVPTTLWKPRRSDLGFRAD
jgi:chemotaxis signal transduction protein